MQCAIPYVYLFFVPWTLSSSSKRHPTFKSTSVAWFPTDDEIDVSMSRCEWANIHFSGVSQGVILAGKFEKRSLCFENWKNTSQLVDRFACHIRPSLRVKEYLWSLHEWERRRYLQRGNIWIGGVCGKWIWSEAHLTNPNFYPRNAHTHTSMVWILILCDSQCVPG